MGEGKRLAAGTAIIGVVALAVYFFGQGRSGPGPPAKAESRIPQLRRLVKEQEKETGEAVDAYAPKATGRLDDLAAPAVEILRQLPGVAHIEVAVRAERLTLRIVHLRDWHYVPKDLYAIDMRNASARELTTEEIDRLHHEHLLEVEAIQLEQMALLRCLIRHHGLRRIYCEGLTAKDLSDYRERIAVLREMEQKQISELQRQLANVRELRKRGQSKIDRHEQAKKIERQITEMIDQHRFRLLEVGSAGRLLITGEIEEVLPLDDTDLLDQAKPVTPEGKIRLDPEKLKARQGARSLDIRPDRPRRRSQPERQRAQAC